MKSKDEEDNRQVCIGSIITQNGAYTKSVREVRMLAHIIDEAIQRRTNLVKLQRTQRQDRIGK